MPNSSLSLQKAIVARLRADSAVTALVGTKVFDMPNENTFPRITLGEDQILFSRADCYLGEDVNITIHAWSRAVGFPEVKRIAGAIQAALHEAELTLDGYRLVDLSVDDVRFLRDADGLSSHAVLNFTALCEPID